MGTRTRASPAKWISSSCFHAASGKTVGEATGFKTWSARSSASLVAVVAVSEKSVSLDSVAPPSDSEDGGDGSSSSPGSALGGSRAGSSSAASVSICVGAAAAARRASQRGPSPGAARSTRRGLRASSGPASAPGSCSGRWLHSEPAWLAWLAGGVPGACGGAAPAALQDESSRSGPGFVASPTLTPAKGEAGRLHGGGGAFGGAQVAADSGPW